MINREDLLSGTRPEINNKVLVTVMEHFEGYQVMDYKGMVWGISMRSKDLGQDVLMSCKQVTGGELSSYTELSDESRQRSIDRMIEMAKRIGANAIINFKFEQTFLAATSSSEVVAFGNAVYIKPIKNYVPTGGLGNILAEFVDSFGQGTPNPKQTTSQTTSRQEPKSEPTEQTPEMAKLTKEDSQIFVICPHCSMKYGADITNDREIKVRNFEDEDVNQKGQQISCIKCGQKFTVPYKQ